MILYFLIENIIYFALKDRFALKAQKVYVSIWLRLFTDERNKKLAYLALEGVAVEKLESFYDSQGWGIQQGALHTHANKMGKSKVPEKMGLKKLKLMKNLCVLNLSWLIQVASAKRAFLMTSLMKTLWLLMMAPDQKKQSY